MKVGAGGMEWGVIKTTNPKDTDNDVLHNHGTRTRRLGLWNRVPESRIMTDLDLDSNKIADVGMTAFAQAIKPVSEGGSGALAGRPHTCQSSNLTTTHTFTGHTGTEHHRCGPSERGHTSSGHEVRHSLTLAKVGTARPVGCNRDST